MTLCKACYTYFSRHGKLEGDAGSTGYSGFVLPTQPATRHSARMSSRSADTSLEASLEAVPPRESKRTASADAAKRTASADAGGGVPQQVPVGVPKPSSFLKPAWKYSYLFEEEGCDGDSQEEDTHESCTLLQGRPDVLNAGKSLFGCGTS